MNRPATDFHPLARRWRRDSGLAILRLKVDIFGAAYDPLCRVGDLVLATWQNEMPIRFKQPQGWYTDAGGKRTFLKEADVEVIERDGRPVRSGPADQGPSGTSVMSK